MHPALGGPVVPPVKGSQQASVSEGQEDVAEQEPSGAREGEKSEHHDGLFAGKK